MAQTDKELTKIERELVLQYLRDDNVPVTVTLEDKPEASDASLKDGTIESEEEKRIPASAVFPVAIPSQQLTVLNQGIILLKNADRTVQPFLGRKVRVQFYFNHVGLYFITEMKEFSQGLALVIPSVIKRVQETETKSSYNFSGKISYTVNGGASVSADCIPLKNYVLFRQPVWGDIETSRQKDAKSLLEKFVAEARKGEGASIGNGLHLLPIVRFLTDENLYVSDAVEGKIKPVNIIYVDSSKIVLACANHNDCLQLEDDYSLDLNFILAENSKLQRKVSISVYVENIYTSDLSEGECYVCTYSSIKPEDERFISERCQSK